MAQKLGLAFLDTGAMYRAATWLVLHSEVAADDTAAVAALVESADITVDFTVAVGGRTAGVGERLTAAPDARVTVTAKVSGVANGVVRFITDEGQTQQFTLPASGTGTCTWLTTPQLAAYIRVEVRHPLPDGTASNGTAMGTTLQLGPMAALTNPVFLDAK